MSGAEDLQAPSRFRGMPTPSQAASQAMAHSQNHEQVKTSNGSRLNLRPGGGRTSDGAAHIPQRACRSLPLAKESRGILPMCSIAYDGTASVKGREQLDF